jgi:hypothetical protein
MTKRSPPLGRGWGAGRMFHMPITREWMRCAATRLSPHCRRVLDIDPQVFGGLWRRCHHAHAVRRIAFVSTIPGSTGIVVVAAPVEGTDAAKAPNRQVGPGLSGVTQRCTFVHEPFQQCIYGDALAPGSSAMCASVSRETSIRMDCSLFGGHQNHSAADGNQAPNRKIVTWRTLSPLMRLPLLAAGAGSVWACDPSSRRAPSPAHGPRSCAPG